MNEINHELGIIALESCRELGEQVTTGDRMGERICTIPASIAFWEQKADCWDNPKPLKVSGVLLTSFAFVVYQEVVKNETVCRTKCTSSNRRLH